MASIQPKLAESPGNRIFWSFELKLSRKEMEQNQLEEKPIFIKLSKSFVQINELNIAVNDLRGKL